MEPQDQASQGRTLTPIYKEARELGGVVLLRIGVVFAPRRWLGDGRGVAGWEGVDFDGCGRTG